MLTVPWHATLLHSILYCWLQSITLVTFVCGRVVKRGVSYLWITIIQDRNYYTHVTSLLKDTFM